MARDASAFLCLGYSNTPVVPGALLFILASRIYSLPDSPPHTEADPLLHHLTSNVGTGVLFRLCGKWPLEGARHLPGALLHPKASCPTEVSAGLIALPQA